MGVNRVGFAITDDEVVCEASNQEIIRRYYAGQCDYKRGIGTLEAAQRGKYIMEESGLSPQDRPVVKAALEKEAQAKSSSSSLTTSNRQNHYRKTIRHHDSQRSLPTQLH